MIKARSTSSLYQPTSNNDQTPLPPKKINNKDLKAERSGTNKEGSRNLSKTDSKSNNKSSLNNSSSKPKLPTKPDFQFPIPPLRRVSEKTVKTVKNKPVELEEGIKLITEESIENIRKSGGESFSFNFKNKEINKTNSKPYLPQKKVISDSIDAIPVGVIKPIRFVVFRRGHS